MHLYEKALNQTIFVIRALSFCYAHFQAHFNLYFTAISGIQEKEVLLLPLSRYLNAVPKHGL